MIRWKKQTRMRAFNSGVYYTTDKSETQVEFETPLYAVEFETR